MQKDKKDESYSPVRMNVLDKDDANLTGTVNVGDVIKLRFYLDDETGENEQCIKTLFHSRLSLTQARYMPFKTFRNGNKSTSPHFLENLRSEVGKDL